MKIKQKLCLLLIGTGGICSLLVAGMAYRYASIMLKEKVASQLVTMRELKKKQVEEYFGTIERQLKTLSQGVMVQEAMLSFDHAYQNLEAGPKGSSQELASVYKKVGDRYRENTGLSFDVEASMPRSSRSRHLQAKFLLTGQGEDQIALEDEHYAEPHQRFHPSLRSFRKEFGFYDIFLVNPKGDVIYSVYKEIDFATNLLNGPHARSGLGSVYKKALALKDANALAFEDFSPYQPSYGAYASFAAMNVYRDQKHLGVLVFQMPVGKINKLMTGVEDVGDLDEKGHWDKYRLGASGESYLVSLADQTMRCESRFFLESRHRDPSLHLKGYLKALKDSGIDMNLNLLKQLNSCIGIAKVQGLGTEACRDGKSGVEFIDDYRGVEVLSAYTPISIFGSSWALLVEMDKAEALEELDELLFDISLLFLVMLACIVAISCYIARGVSDKITSIRDVVGGLADKDLRHRVKDLRDRSELGEMAQAMNHSLDEISKVILAMSEYANQLSGSSVELKSTSTSLKDKNDHVNVLSGKVSETTKAVAEASESMASSVEELSVNSSSLSSTTEQLSINMSSVSGAVEQLNVAMSSIQENAESASTKAEKAQHLSNESQHKVTLLSESANEISNITDVIKKISEQTNLLALNATIEAASAGDAGKGFSVVANEIKELAKQSEGSTQRITEMIAEIQSNTTSTVDVISEIGRSVSDMAEALLSITSMISQQASAMQDISANIAESTTGVGDLSKSVGEMKMVSEDLAKTASELSHETVEASRHLEEVSGHIEENVKEISKVDLASDSVQNHCDGLRAQVEKFKQA